MLIEVTTPEGTTRIYVDDAPNQRDARLVAMRIITGHHVPPEGTTAAIIDLYAEQPVSR